jgi:hypothetical protein
MSESLPRPMRQRTFDGVRAELARQPSRSTDYPLRVNPPETGRTYDIAEQGSPKDP